MASWHKYITGGPPTVFRNAGAFAPANVRAGPTGLAGAYGAASALAPVHSMVGMAAPTDADRYYAEQLEKELERLNYLKEEEAIFGKLVTDYTLSARLGPILTNSRFIPFWRTMSHVSLLFRGTFTPIGEPNIWDPSSKAVIATSSTAQFADMFALKLYSDWHPEKDYMGHLYILLVAPGVKYINVSEQAKIPSLTKRIIHNYVPILKNFVSPIINEEDEYVLLSNPNVKIIYDSPPIATSTFHQHNKLVIPSFNHIVNYVLGEKKPPMHNVLSKITTPDIFLTKPSRFKGDPFLHPFRWGSSFDPSTMRDYQVSYIQIHIALYGFDGVAGSSPSVTVVGAPAGSDVTYKNIPNVVRAPVPAATGGAGTMPTDILEEDSRSLRSVAPSNKRAAGPVKRKQTNTTRRRNNTISHSSKVLQLNKNRRTSMRNKLKGDRA